MRPKTLPKRLKHYKQSEQLATGVTAGIITSISTSSNQISETVEVNNPTANPTNTIVESSAVVIT